MSYGDFYKLLESENSADELNSSMSTVETAAGSDMDSYWSSSSSTEVQIFNINCEHCEVSN